MFNGTKLATKLYFSFIVVAIITAIVGYIGYSAMEEMQKSQHEIGKVCLPGIEQLMKIQIAQTGIKAQELGLSIRRINSVSEREVFLKIIEVRWGQVDSAWKIYTSLPQSTQEAKLWKEFIPVWQKWKESCNLIVEYSREKNKLIEAGSGLDTSAMSAVDDKIFNEVQNSRKLYTPAEDLLSQVVDENINLSNIAENDADISSNSSLRLIMIFIMGGFLLSILFGIVITNNVKNQLGGDPIYVMSITNKVAAGDLSMKIDLKGKKQTSLIAQMDVMINSIKALVADADKLAAAAIAGKLDTRADASKHAGEYKAIVDGINKALDAIIGPLNVAAEYVDRISKGDIPPKITDNYNGDFNEIKNNVNGCIDNISALVADANKLAAAAIAGKLDVRADAAKHGGDFRKIVDGVNGTLDAVIGPLNVAAEYVDRISKGDIPPKITDKYNGDFNEIKNNLNGCIDNISALVTDANKLAAAAIAGKLDIRADAAKHGGDFRKIVEGVNNTLDAVIGPLNVTAEYVDRISKGDIPPMITDEYRGDFNEIKNNLNLCITAINNLVSDSADLSDNAIKARLRIRADAARHGGDFRKIVNGINKTLDSIVGFIDKIPLPIMAIDQNYNIIYINDSASQLDNKPHNLVEGGKCYDHFKTNHCQTQNCACSLSLSNRHTINSSTVSHAGGKNLEVDYSAIPVMDEFGKIQGAFEIFIDQTLIKSTLNRSKVVSDYQDNEVVKIVQCLDDLSVGNLDFLYAPEKAIKETQGAFEAFNRIGQGLNKSADKVKLLAQDANILTKTASEGRLDFRTDESKHFGEYKNIILGFNNTLNNVIGPLNVAAEYVDRISKGDIPPVITDEYRGDFNEIKNNINQLIGNLSSFVTEMNHMSKEHDLGDIDVNMDDNKFQGSYKEMAKGVNKMVFGHIEVKKAAMRVFDQYGLGEFSANLDRLKGKKVFINNTIDSVRNNLIKLTDEIKSMIEQVKNGELSSRIDSNKFSGDWKKMVNGLNEIVDSFAKPLEEAGEVLSEMATGDLTVKMTGVYKGNFEQLKSNVNALGISLNDLISQVTTTANSAASSAFQISSSADSLSTATHEQSAHADEVASAVEEMAKTITENALSANRTSEVAARNGEIATEGGKVVLQTVEKMRDIADVVKNSAESIQKLGESSKQIGEIVSVIDDIADQTNLLALNAAIEAARAGDHGRGFAVVADEVRKLAERTTEATKRIASMIKAIQEETSQAVAAMNIGTNEVKSGILLADKAGSSLQEILMSTNEVLEMINLIAAASEEQSATSEQIAQNVTTISKVTAESSKRVEEVALTSDELAKLTESLLDLLRNFKFEDASTGFSTTKMIRDGRKNGLKLPGRSIHQS